MRALAAKVNNHMWNSSCALKAIVVAIADVSVRIYDLVLFTGDVYRILEQPLAMILINVCFHVHKI